jgi:hydrogenase maturation protein HypF
MDFRPLLRALVEDRLRGRDAAEIARSFHRGIATGLCDAVRFLCRNHGIDTVVLSGGVFQNELLLGDVKALLEGDSLQIWTNHLVPANDGGISLGQAALAAFNQLDADSERRSRDASRLTAISEPAPVVPERWAIEH